MMVLGRCSRSKGMATGKLLATATTAVLVAVSGTDTRRHCHAVARLPGVSLVFPLGCQLRVWLETGRSLSDFETDLRQLAPTLTVQPLQPTLQDATLRELALADDPGNENES